MSVSNIRECKQTSFYSTVLNFYKKEVRSFMVHLFLFCKSKKGERIIDRKGERTGKVKRGSLGWLSLRFEKGGYIKSFNR